MRSKLLVLLCLYFGTLAAQAPQLINYQGIARDATGNAIVSQTIGIRFELIQGAATSPTVYSEAQTVVTNSLGLFNTQIGKNSPGALDTMKWNAGNFYLQIAVDINGGSAYSVIGIQQLVSVPFALNARSVPAAYSATSNVLTVGNSTFVLNSGITYTAGPGITITSGSIISASPTLTLLPPNTLSITGGSTLALPEYSLSQNSNSISLTRDGTVIATSTLAATTLSLSGIENNTLSAGGNSVVLNTYTTGPGLALAGTAPNYTLSSTVSTPTITGSGIAAVTPSTGPAYTVSVPGPSLTYGSNTLTINQGTASSAVNIPPPTLGLTGAANNSLTAGGNTVALNTYTNGAGISMTNLGNNYTISAIPVNPTITGTGAAVVTPTTGTTFNVNVAPTTIALTNSVGALTSATTGVNIFNINVPQPVYSPATGILTTGAATTNVTPTLGLSGNVLTVGPATNNITLPLTQTVTGTGIAAVTPTTGNNFAVNVPAPVFGNVGPVTITGSYPNLTVNSPTVPATTTISGTGIAAVTPTTGTNFAVNVPAPVFGNVGPVTITGSYPNLTVNSPTVPATTTITGAGIAVVTPSTGSNFVVTVPQTTFAFSNSTGSLTSGTSSAYIVPTLTINNNVITSGPASNSIILPASVTIAQGGAAVVTQTGSAFTVNVPATGLTGAGIVTVSPAGTNTWNIGVPSPVFTPGGSASVTGAWPNYTISAPVPVAPNLTLSGTDNNVLTAGNNSVTFNTYTAGNGISFTGGPNFTISSSVSSWSLGGNAGTTPSLNFLGTTDDVDLNFRVNNQRAGRIQSQNGSTYYGLISGPVSNTLSWNTGIGNEALMGLISGDFNTAIGDWALRQTTSGWGNIAIGEEPLTNNLTGQLNLAIGYQAMHENVSGINNIGIGIQALHDNNGDENLAMGTGAIATNTTGTQNTILGHYAGYQNTTGSGNVFIGYGAGYAETGSDRLHIANSNTAAPMIFGDFITGNVGLSTFSASAELQFRNSLVNRKIVMWEDNNNDHEFYGFGINNNLQRYQVGYTGADHAFFAGTGNASSNELMRIKGTGEVGIGTSNPLTNLHVNGMVRMGSETGTGQGPNYPNGGMIIRRAFTNVTTQGQVVARTNVLTFERDGSNGGFQITSANGNQLEVCNCTAVNSSGTVVGRALNNLANGTTAVFTNADNIVSFHCIFGSPYIIGEQTEVTFTRQFSDWYWLGTIISSTNQ